MKDKPFYYQDNRALHEKRLHERVRAAISKQNIEFVLAHQNDSLPELARYVRQCKAELGHVPARTEIIGGEYLELRFGSWFNVLKNSGYVDCPGAVNNTPWSIRRFTVRNMNASGSFTSRPKRTAKRQPRPRVVIANPRRNAKLVWRKPPRMGARWNEKAEYSPSRKRPSVPC